MPVDPDSKFNSILKKRINNQAYSKSYTRSSYLLLKDGKGYKAYIMTIVGDSSYIKGNPDKLANNTYRQHDADFSGLVLYFTPKGKYVNGYAYHNGQLVTPGSQTQSQGKTKVQLAEICTDWYDEILINDVIVSSTYLYTTCEGGYEDPENPESSGSPAPPDANPCNTPPPPPPPVTPPPSVPGQPTVPPVPMAMPGGHLIVNNVPGGGGGFPPPVEDDEGDPCTNEPPEIRIDNLLKKYPCMVKLILNKLLTTPNYYNIVEPFTSIKKPDLVWKDGALPWNSAVPNSSEKTYVLGKTDFNDRSATITLNTSMLNNSSQLLVAAASIHETLHAYINYNIVTAVGGFLPPQNYDTNGSWIYSLNTWAMVNGLPTNYVDHYEMMTDYFNKSIDILSSIDNNQHTPKEYAMAMLYGMENGISGDSAQQALLQSEYNSLLTEYGITSSDKNSFNIKNLNASSNKLPTSGCN